jgi:prophage antirepressor-like protein
MDILKEFVFDNIDHSVYILKEEKHCEDIYLFKANDIAGILGLKRIKNSVRNFDEDEKVIRQIKTAGGIQDVLFLTQEGLYRLLLSSKKPVAKPFRKWVFKVIKEIEKTGKYEVENLKEELKKTKEEMYYKHHKVIIKLFKGKSIVYIGKIRNIEDKILIKIGSTDQLDKRIYGLNGKFGKLNLFKAYECHDFRKFEKYLKEHKDIKSLLYKKPVNDKGQTSTESYLMTEKDIEHTVNIAEANIIKFRVNPTVPTIGDELHSFKTEILEKLDSISNVPGEKEKPKVVKFESSDRNHTQTRGPKIQRYSSDGKDLLKTYESYMSVMRDDNIIDTSKSGIDNAIKRCTVYKGFRWAKLNRDLPDDTHQELKKTVKLKGGNVRKGLVAMLNLNKDTIVQVFENGKAAANNRKFKTGAPISRSIREGTQSGGHYFKLWAECDKKLQAKYLENNELPVKKSTKNSKQIDRVDANDNIKVYGTVQQVLKEYHVSRQTLYKAIKFEYPLKGFKWKFHK